MRYHYLSDHAIEVQDEGHRDFGFYLALGNFLKMNHLSGLEDLSYTKTSLAVLFDPFRFDEAQWKSLLDIFEYDGSIAGSMLPEAIIPVCYEAEFAPDMKVLTHQLGLDRQAVIDAHQAALYTVVMYGFVPGFFYMDGLPGILEIPRKSSPSLSIPEGSVAIAGLQCGIYPREVPGGWYVIGRTPRSFFDPGASSPFQVEVGQRVRFTAITSHEFYHYHD
ncbi:MAG: allophanate hydrolase subunit 1 [Cyclobacteriaceae bacterium]|nr:allophanate hydrolase subunit 1 [Cyclobacteriaceae bacterium]